MWAKNQANYYLPLIFGCVAYVGKFLSTKQVGPIIEIASGKIRGAIAYSREGREYFQYLGIPYAQPPVGDLRFQSPVAARNWTDVLSADRFSSPCIGVEFLTSGRLQGQEDCLYLNVFVPNIGSEGVKTKLLPVMVFIHGGGFITGSACAYGEQYFMDEDIILVSMNYRLGILGFLSTGDSVVRGNMGLKDQRLAMQWVQQNIEGFGGDPKKVTIFGESAGGASVHYHVLSHQSRGLFDKAISMSGNSLNPFWQTNRSHEEQVNVLAKRFDCPTDTMKLFVDCMKQIDAYSLASIHEAVQSPIHPLHDAFSPSVEKISDSEAFLATQPYELLRTGNFNHVPWLTGANEAEGLVFVARVLFNKTLADTLTSEDIWNKYMPIILFYDEEKRNASAEIRRKYFGRTSDYSIQGSSENFAKLFSDRLFFQSIHTTAHLHAKHSQLFLYHYTYRGATNVFDILSNISPYYKLPMELHVIVAMLKNWILKSVFGIMPPSYGPCHGDEMLMLFSMSPFIDVSHRNVEDYEMSKAMVKTWANFAQDHTSLKFRHLGWHPYQQEESLQYMILDSQGALLEDPFSKSLKVWEDFDIL